MATQPSRDLAHKLSRAERLLAGRMATALAAEDCTLEEWRVLKVLADGSGHIMTEVAASAMVPDPSLTTLIDRMVSDGLVYRRADGQDRHRVLAYLSLHGRDMYERAAEVLTDAEAQLAATLGDNGELGRWLARLEGVLSAVPTSPSPVPATS